ncbi:MAG: hypothetical protein QXD62_01535 [Candidatus Woesearchaeota archaeon]
MKKILNLIVGLLLVLVMANNVFGIGVELSKIEVNGYSTLDATLPLYIERSNELDIDIWFSANTDYSNVQVYAFLSGYEYGEIRDNTPVFDIKSGVMYHRTLNLRLPQILDTGRYLLRIIFADRSGTIKDSVYEIPLYVGTARNLLEIRNVMFIPGRVVKQGDSLLVAARIENLGEKDERDVKVTVEVPRLGIYQVDYVDLIKSGEILSSDYLMLTIPNCAAPGEYDVKVSISYNRNTVSTFVVGKISVVESGACLTTQPQLTEKKTTITLSSKTYQIKSGETATYAVTFKNEGSKDSLYKIEAVVPNNWGSVKISPASSFVLKSGEVKTVFVSITPTKNVVGEQMFQLLVKVDEETREIPLTTVVEPKEESLLVFQIALIVLIVVLIVLGILIGTIRASKKKEKKEEEETYY